MRCLIRELHRPYIMSQLDPLRCRPRSVFLQLPSMRLIQGNHRKDIKIIFIAKVNIGTYYPTTAYSKKWGARRRLIMIFCSARIRFKKLLVPLLIILKLFKLKLLLFLPLILGLASFKKVLGFLALAIPGVIGYLRFCKPDMLHSGYGAYGHSSFYRPPPPHRNHPPPHL